MQTLSVNVRRAARQVGQVGQAVLSPDLETDLARARRLADLLDTRFSAFGVRFGLDNLIGLVPGVGDTVTAALGAYPILLAQRHGLGKTVQARMAGNLVVDWLVGLVPGLDLVFDVAFKANIKNLRLLEAAAAKRAGRPEARG